MTSKPLDSWVEVKIQTSKMCGTNSVPNSHIVLRDLQLTLQKPGSLVSILVINYLIEQEEQMIAFEGENQDLGNPEYKKFIMKELLESLPLTEAGMRNLRGTRSQYREVPQTLPGVTNCHKTIYDEKK